MRSLFIDTSYLAALIDRGDGLHEPALVLAAELRSPDVRYVTSEIVLVELLTYFSGYGAEARESAAAYAIELRDDPLAEVVSQTRQLLDDALDLYQRRLDKSYSMVDCIGMVICRKRRITEVLTADHDFEQEGLTILLQ